MSSAAKQYVDMAASLFSQNMPEDFTPPMMILQRHGRHFLPQPKPQKYPWGRPRECHHNALMLLMDYPQELYYCEGYAVNSNVPGFEVHHSWCVDRRGNVIDNTWRDGGIEYFGLAIEQYAVLKMADNIRGGFHLLFNPELKLLYAADPAAWLVPKFHRAINVNAAASEL